MLNKSVFWKGEVTIRDHIDFFTELGGPSRERMLQVKLLWAHFPNPSRITAKTLLHNLGPHQELLKPQPLPCDTSDLCLLLLFFLHMKKNEAQKVQCIWTDAEITREGICMGLTHLSLIMLSPHPALETQIYGRNGEQNYA